MDRMVQSTYHPAALSASPVVDARPGLVIICNSIAPYHVSLNRIVADGIPEFKLHSVFTHGKSVFDWPIDLPPEIHASSVSQPGDSPLDRVYRRPLAELRKGNRLIRYVQENKAQAVIFNGYGYISYLRLMDYCYRHRIPFFYRNDSNIRDELKHSFLKQTVKKNIYHWWMKRAAGVLSMGRLGDQFFIKYGANANRLYRVPCWPDFESFATIDTVGLTQFRRKFRLSEGRRYLVFSGRLVPEKRVDLLVDAFGRIASDRPDWDLLIVGDGVLRGTLESRVPDALRPRVIWTGFLQGPELPAALHAADVLVLPSDREPWALVVQEAMAAGLAVISSNISGAAYDLIEDGQSGRIFPAGDLEQLEEAILDVTADEALPTYKRESARALAKWRSEVNPVAEIRKALADAGVLPTSGNND